MKSVVQEGSSVAKAVEKALQVAGYPREFSVKILEDPKKNFLGMTVKSAKISLFFEEKRIAKPSKREVRVRKREPRKRPSAPQQRGKAAAVVSERVKQPAKQVFWTDQMVGMAKEWVDAALKVMQRADVSFKIDVNRYYLRITLTKPLHADEGKERQIFRSFSYLILQALRTKLQRPLRGFKIVVTRGGNLKK